MVNIKKKYKNFFKKSVNIPSRDSQDQYFVFMFLFAIILKSEFYYVLFNIALFNS